MNLLGRDITVFFSVGSFFPTVMLPLFGLILGPTIGAFRRVNAQLIDPV
jgi:hypothetical protein